MQWSPSDWRIYAAKAQTKPSDAGNCSAVSRVSCSSCSHTHVVARLVRAYNQSAATLNLLRGFSTGGYASLDRVLKWNLDFMSNSDEAQVWQL